MKYFFYQYYWDLTIVRYLLCQQIQQIYATENSLQHGGLGALFSSVDKILLILWESEGPREQLIFTDVQSSLLFKRMTFIFNIPNDLLFYVALNYGFVGETCGFAY